MLRRTLPILLLGFSLACNTTSSETGIPAPAPEGFVSKASAEYAAQAPSQQSSADRAVARQAQMDVVLQDVETGARQIRDLTASIGGYVVQANGFLRNERLFYHLMVRVPASGLSGFLQSVRGMALRVVSEQEAAEDVTDQMLDLGIRIQNLRTVETELRRLLAESRERKSKVADIMEVLERLSDIRNRIERLEAQEMNLNQRVEMALVTLNLSPEPILGPMVEEPWRPLEILSGAVRTLLVSLQFLFSLAVYAAIVILPTLALTLLPLWLLIRLFLKRKTSEVPLS